MSDITGDAIQKVVDLTRLGNKPSVLKVDQEPPDVYFLVGADGTATRQTAAPRWHNEALANPGELLRFIKDGEFKNGTSYIGDDKIVFVYDQSDRKDQASVALIQSPQYKWLATESASQMTQVQLIRLLRITFKGCLQSENILPLLRQLKFENGAAVDTDIQNSRASMGKQILQKVSGQSEMPEEIGFNLPVFENHPLRVNVQCAVEMFPAEQSFKLTPYPLQVRAAFDAAMDDLLMQFGAKGLPPAYRGKP